MKYEISDYFHPIKFNLTTLPPGEWVLIDLFISGKPDQLENYGAHIKKLYHKIHGFTDVLILIMWLWNSHKYELTIMTLNNNLNYNRQGNNNLNHYISRFGPKIRFPQS